MTLKSLKYILFGSIIILGIWFAYLWLNPVYCPMEENLKCGVTYDSSEASIYHKIGKNLFIENCIQCHSKNMNQSSIAPALIGTFVNWDNDTISFLRYINNSEEYLNNTNDKRILNLKSEYKFGMNSHKNDFNLEQIEELLDFIDNEK